MSPPRPTPADIERAIRNVPDFPKPGIQFKDITPVLADARLFSGSIDLLVNRFVPGMVDAVVGLHMLYERHQLRRDDDYLHHRHSHITPTGGNVQGF